ncbi:hypothetical protein GXM_04472 [Nostoc sphaeroides CCNUC1]|uniref:Uncharacterized protein n=1 Tax=Nostoc sphaeroides CCNUC1 TaxID=2653204 RepID=A0A5P8W333_9NOSO|nr:hypothetical protein GXM_04472 [Nostoc sphaeroides CCNUC1]
MDEVNPSITELKVKACIVAIYVTGLVIGHSYFLPLCPPVAGLKNEPQRHREHREKERKVYEHLH